MSGRIIFVPKSAHKCDPPEEVEDYAPGTIWMCDNCTKQLVLVRGAQYNEVYSVWRLLSDKNRHGGE